MDFNLTEIGNCKIWRKSHEQSFAGISLRTNMTAVLCENDFLWVHSPVPLSSQERELLDSLGKVKWVIAPNLFHHLYLGGFIEHYPDAITYAPAGIEKKCSMPSGYEELRSVAHEWESEIRKIPVAGAPGLGECVFFHNATGSLIVTDILFSVIPTKNLVRKFVLALLDLNRPVAVSRTMRFMIKDKSRFVNFAEEIRHLDIQRLLAAHERVLEDDAKQHVLAALRSYQRI